MCSKHLKRLAAPRVLSIPKKVHKFIVKASPGPYPVEEAIPLLLIIRDMLHYCDTGREARRIIGRHEVLVDGKIVTNPKFPVGLMSVVSIPKTGENFRVLIDRHGKLRLVKITDDESKWKLTRIENKTIVDGGKMQLNLYDGRNIIVQQDIYKTGDVLKIEVPSQKILAHYRLTEGNIALLIGGKHVGELAVVERYDIRRGREPNMVYLKDGKLTIKDNVFVVGERVPEIKLPEILAL